MQVISKGRFLRGLRPYVIPTWIGDTAIGTITALQQEDRWVQERFFARPEYENEEDTPGYFSRHTPSDLVVTANVLTAGQMKWPLLPEVDTRALSNQDWQSPARHQLNTEYCHKYGVFPDIFPAPCPFEVNLSIQYSDMYWMAAHFGNYIPAAEVQNAPKVVIGSDPVEGIDENTHFTLMMFTPDYPFRADPEDGHLLHWVVSNLTLGTRQGVTVVDYMPPLPTEYAGHFRQIFALFKQPAKIDFNSTSPDSNLPLSARRNFFLHSNFHPTLDLVQACLPPTPSALTFFHTSYDCQVSQYYQTHLLEEPIYTPPPISKELAMAKKYKRLHSFQTYQRAVQWDARWPVSKTA
eukprot:NODE_2544_length_1151_cov_27.039062_g2425_i0.p1 GENE.NODE_2544_length_1151_cov_27.039062_g2425_i0~~NODE_2544_length_1151_cov_27.039062_g2425_i0.p1  ORF type:complete len:368 (-),score=85.21 NODE_2544_length_1151_cov_27.039062_g2425_i0:47-1099(-)